LLPITEKQNTTTIYFEITADRSDGKRILVRAPIDVELAKSGRRKEYAEYSEGALRDLRALLETYLDDNCKCRFGGRKRHCCPVHNLQ
jgi:hypothetical protein